MTVINVRAGVRNLAQRVGRQDVVEAAKFDI